MTLSTIKFDDELLLRVLIMLPGLNSALIIQIMTRVWKRHGLVRGLDEKR